ncbi:MAG: hypothetical protein K9G71_11365 [Rhodobacteraceae bacterium]|nr:hypothetical protein [Paracoccaceae bacterium]MCF8514955.1 hypothetical protein [Paracoccaceae bacterium]MCF8519199.1 hypothetical protein [Paracoccaceae bacterium]
MNRRLFLSLGVCAAVFGQAGFAKTFTESVLDQLRNQGFDRISVQRTLLGRTQIIARGNGGRREIILNPRTGEILRDLWITGSDGPDTNDQLIKDQKDGKGRGRGRSGDDDDDDDQDNDDSGDDDDNSGKGGGDDSDGDDSGGDDGGDDDDN